jgi:hypothetical protein
MHLSCSASSAVASVRQTVPDPCDQKTKKEKAWEERAARIPWGSMSWEKKTANKYTTVYFFVGCIIAGDKFYNYIPAAIVAFIGLAYIALEFVPSIEPPANMRYVVMDWKRDKTSLEWTLTILRDADAGWGAEQV